MKKQTKNRFLSLLLATALTLSCSVPAFAAEDGQLEGDTPAATEVVETNDLQISPESVQNLTKGGVSYKDGTYEGTGTGYDNGEIKLKVTITGGEISKVELVSQQKQTFWMPKNVASLFDKIVEANTAEVDGISGATDSSNGVKAAVRDALSKAGQPLRSRLRIRFLTPAAAPNRSRISSKRQRSCRLLPSRSTAVRTIRDGMSA